MLSIFLPIGNHRWIYLSTLSRDAKVMKRRLFTIVFFLPSVCFAQPIPHAGRSVAPSNNPTGLNWALSTKADATNGILANPKETNGTYNNPLVSGGSSTNQSVSAPIISNGTMSGTAVNAALSAADIPGSVSRALSSRQADRVSAYDFGAKCDGSTDDTAALQKAVNATSAAGSPLQIRGVCITGTLNIPDGTFIEGSLQGATLKLSAGGGTWLLNLNNTASSIVINHLTLDGANLPTNTQSSLIYRADNDSLSTNGKSIYIINNRFINIPTSPNQYAHAVILHAVDGGYIYGNQIDQSSGDGLNFNDGYYFVANNRISHSGDGCIAFNNSARGVVIGNVLSSCNLGVGAGPEGNQTDTDIAQNLSVIGNTFESNFIGTNFGWFAYSGRSAPTNWQITGNTFRNTESVGVEFDGADNSLITSGVVANNSFYGTGANNFDGTYQSAPVDIRIGSANVVSVTGNTISSPKGTGGNQSGIQIVGSQSYTVSGNIISDPSPTHYARGIASENSQYGAIAGNTVNNVNYGIVGEGGLGLSYTSVSGNSLIGISNTGIASGDVAGYTSINNNLISGPSTTTGITVPSKSYSLSIVGNIINVSNGVGIVDNAANWIATTIRSNTVGSASAPAEQTNTTGGNVTN